MGASKVKSKLGWVEFGRGWAAFVVFISHGFFMGVPAQYENIFLWGRWGVCFFFVLSGFIIAHVHWKDIGSPSRVGNFIWRRLVRIFPTYWLALLVFIFARNFLGNPDYRLIFSPLELIGNVTLWPTLPDLLLPMAWTLRHELLFYGLFAVAILDKRLGAGLFGLWLALLIWNVAHQSPCEMLTVAAQRCMSENSAPIARSPLWLLISANVNLYFFVGIGLSLALRTGVIGLVALVSVAVASLAFSADWLIGSTYALALFQATTFATLVSFTIWLSTKNRAPAFALWMGEVSYAFYLMHMTTMLVAHGILKRLGSQVPWQVEPLFALGMTLLVSHMVTRYFDKPVREWLMRTRDA